MAKLRDYYHLLWLVAIVMCAFAAVFVVFVVSCTKSPAAAEEPTTEITPAEETLAAASAEPSVTPTPEPSPTPEPISVDLQETEDMGEDYLSRFIFLGDSTTYGLAAYDALPWPQMWTTSLGTLDLSAQSYAMIDVYSEDGSVQSMTIKDAVTAAQPEYLIITLGLNGISYMSEEDFKEEYTDLVGMIQGASPDTKIILNTIYPVIDAQAPGGISNAGVNQANVWIHDIAEITGTRFLNTHDVLMDETGNLRSDYCNGDGIHLDTPGCQAVLMNVRTHGYR